MSEIVNGNKVGWKPLSNKEAKALILEFSKNGDGGMGRVKRLLHIPRKRLVQIRDGEKNFSFAEEKYLKRLIMLGL